MLNRRTFLGGLAALAAPAVITTPGLLMPVRKVLLPAPPPRKFIVHVSQSNGEWQAVDLADPYPDDHFSDASDAWRRYLEYLDRPGQAVDT